MAEIRVDPGAWDRAVAMVGGPQLVVAGPGAGKTEFLVRRCVHLVDSGAVEPQDVLLLSFGRRGVADLRTRIEDALDRSFTELAASTFHSFAHRLLETHGDRLGWRTMPVLMTGPDQIALVRDLLGDEDPDAWPVMFRGLLGSDAFGDEVTDFILRCRERLIDPEALASFDRADWRALPRFIRSYDDALAERNVIDYGTLLERAVRVLEDDEVRSSVAMQHPYVLVDEYQDTTVVQARLLELMYEANGNLTVAGDPYQSIYSFRGAEVDNIARFPERIVTVDGAETTRIVLTTSFRVPQSIIDRAAAVTAGTELPGAAGPVTGTQAVGTVSGFQFTQLSEEAEWIASEVQRLWVTQQIPLSSMAVLVRSKRQFVAELSRALERRGIPHERPDRRLADATAVSLVTDLVTAACGVGSERAQAIRRIALGPLLGLGVGGWRQMRAEVGSDDEWALAFERLGYSSLGELLRDSAWARSLPADQALWHLWSSLSPLHDLVLRVPEHGHVLASLAQVLSGFVERTGGESLLEYVRRMEAEEVEATPLLGHTAAAGDRLTITTLHQAKGLEFEVVFLANAVETVLPDLRPRDSILQTRMLAQRPGNEVDQHRSRLQEEVRLAYTAMTRASRSVIWTATAASGDAQGPSRFMVSALGLDGSDGVPAHERSDESPITRQEAEGWLRRTVDDITVPDAERLAAVSVLVTSGARSVRELHGFHEPGSDTGLLPPDLTLSPSQAQLYEECPQRYALERRLGIGDRPSVYAELGTLIHAALEHADRKAMDSGRRSTVDDALEELRRRFRPEAFGHDPWAPAWLARAQLVIERLFELWPNDDWQVEDVEREVAAEIDGIEWRGRIDRVDRAGDALRVVDYKTGGQVMAVADAERSLQLAFYAIAASADTGLDGEVTAAELWYPAIESKSLTTRSLDLAELGSIEERMREAGVGILSEHYEPNPGKHCERCNVRPLCPAWPEGMEAFA